jgi:quercetin dioxygenase-like cupin family protein
MVLKANDMQKGGFIGIPFNMLSAGMKPMVTKMSYKSGEFIPEHTHPKEQSGYVLSGIYLLRLDEVDEILIKGDYFSIPANNEHSIEVIETGEILEVLDSPGLDLS